MNVRSGENKPRVHAMEVVQDAVRQAMDTGALRPGDPVAVFFATSIAALSSLLLAWPATRLTIRDVLAYE